MNDTDGSLASARTALAWRRTGLGYAAVALVAARHGNDGGLTGHALLALACASAAAGLALAWGRSGSAGRRIGHGGDMLFGSAVAVAASLSTLLGVHLSP